MSTSSSLPQPEPEPTTNEQNSLIAEVRTRLAELIPLLVDLGKSQSGTADRVDETRVRGLLAELSDRFQRMPSVFIDRRGWRGTKVTSAWPRKQRPDFFETARHAWYVIDQIQSMIDRQINPQWAHLRARAYQLNVCSNAFRGLFPQVDEAGHASEVESGSEIVTLREIAALVKVTKETLRNWKNKDSGTFPKPIRRPKPGQRSEFYWADFRIYLQTVRSLGPFESKFPRELVAQRINELKSSNWE